MSIGPGRRPSADDLDEEMRTHLEMAIRDRIARGESPDEARLNARREFGNVPLAREVVRDVWGWRWLDALRDDLRYSVRTLVRSPVLAGTAILTLAVGIGAVGAVFSVLDRIFAEAPAGVRDPGGIARLVFFRPQKAGDVRVTSGAGFPDLDDFRAATAGRASAEGYELASDPPFSGSPNRLAFTTTGYFALLGIAPAVGRFYSADENRRGDPSMVVVLSYALWRSTYGGDSAVLGRTIAIDSVPFRVIGVAGRSFDGVDVDAIEMWVPYAARDAQFFGTRMFSRMGAPKKGFSSSPVDQRHGRGLTLLVRQRPGTDRGAIEAALNTAYRRSAVGEDAEDSLVTVHLTPLLAARGPHARGVIDDRHMGLVVTVGAVAAITLVICIANVATLLLLRALRRRHEIAVRLALGVSRTRLAQQVVTESLVLAAVAGALSVAFAVAGGRFLRLSLLSTVHWPATIVGLRGVVLLATISVVAGVAAGLVPAVFASDLRVMDTLKAGTPGAGYGHPRVRALLIVLQASMCVVLLVCSGVFVQSLHRALTIDLGFDADRLAELYTAQSGDAAASTSPTRAAQIARIPGVERVSVESGNALNSNTTLPLLFSNGDSVPVDQSFVPNLNQVDTGYFRTVGIPVEAGRAIDARDVETSQAVAVISDAMARRLWGWSATSSTAQANGRNPLNDCLYVAVDEAGKPLGPCVAIVGIVADSRATIQGAIPPRIYLPLTQSLLRYYPHLRGRSTYGGSTIAIRFARPPSAEQLREVRAVGEHLPANVFGERPSVALPMETLAPELAPWRLAANLFSVFGLATLLLAGVGLYGLISYETLSRTRELGVRLALGARPRDIVANVFASSLRISAIAIVVGILAALEAVRATRSLLFNTSPADPVVLIGVVATLLIAAIAASVFPAWRATRVDPAVVLRTD